jgi:hypothetical protein
MSSIPESINKLAFLKVIDLRENMFDRQEQNRIKSLFPNIVFHFSAACSCGK